MTFPNNFDPDKALQNMGPNLRSKVFDIQILYKQYFEWKEQGFVL